MNFNRTPSVDKLSDKLNSISMNNTSRSAPAIPPPPLPKRPERKKPTTRTTNTFCEELPSLGAFKRAPLKEKFRLPLQNSDSEHSRKSKNYSLTLTKEFIFASSNQTIFVFRIGSPPSVYKQIDLESSITCLIGVDEKVWIGTVDGNLIILDGNSLEILCLHSHVHDSVLELRKFDDSVLSIGADKKVLVWDTCSLIASKILVSSLGTGILISGKDLYLKSRKTVTFLNESLEKEYELDPTSCGVVNIGAVVTVERYGESLFVFHEDGKILQWDLEKKHVTRHFSIGPYKIKSVLRHETHFWIVLSTGRILVVDVDSWRIFSEWKSHSAPIISLQLSGNLIVSLDEDDALYTWDATLCDAIKFKSVRSHQLEWATFEPEDVLVCSWNVGASKPPSLGDVDFWRSWIGTLNPPTLIVFGLQEVIQLESKRAHARIILGNPKETRFDLWAARLMDAIAMFQTRATYRPVIKETLVGLYTIVFVRSDRLDQVKFMSTSIVKCGLGGLHGNKGSVCARIILRDSSLCFLNCHLAAGHDKVAARNSDAGFILKTGQFTQTSPEINEHVFINGSDGSAVEDIEHCVLFGDLNYRIDASRGQAIEILNSGSYGDLLLQDQLNGQISTSSVFSLNSFLEGPISFPPTYKFDVGTNDYDTGDKQRVPAWCDRVLVRSCTGLPSVQPSVKLYEAIMEPVQSDHKPIRALLSLPIRAINPPGYIQGETSLKY